VPQRSFSKEIVAMQGRTAKSDVGHYAMTLRKMIDAGTPGI
jgi:hypothetical protein